MDKLSFKISPLLKQIEGTLKYLYRSASLALHEIFLTAAEDIFSNLIANHSEHFFYLQLKYR